jgi:cytokinin dehydrogenase
MSSFNPQDPVQANQFKTDKKVLFCLEMTKNFNPEEADIMEQVRQQFILVLLNMFMH